MEKTAELNRGANAGIAGADENVTGLIQAIEQRERLNMGNGYLGLREGVREHVDDFSSAQIGGIRSFEHPKQAAPIRLLVTGDARKHVEAMYRCDLKVGQDVLCSAGEPVGWPAIEAGTNTCSLECNISIALNIVFRGNTPFGQQGDDRRE